MDTIIIRMAIRTLSTFSIEQRAKIWYEDPYNPGTFKFPDAKQSHESAHGYLRRMGEQATPEAVNYLADFICNLKDRLDYQPGVDPND